VNDGGANVVNLRSIKTLGGSNNFEIGNTFAGGGTWAFNAGITDVSNDGLEIRDVTNGATRMVIQQTGNVGIGTTNIEAWASSHRALQIGGQTSIMSNTSEGAGSAVYFTQGGYYDGAWKYRNTASDEATRFYMTNGTFAVSTAPAGDPDAALTWSDRLFINNTGAVGIGTATPTASTMVTINDNQGDNSAGLLNIIASNASDWAFRSSNGTQVFQAYTNSSGNFQGTGQFTDGSSKELKKDFEQVGSSELIDKLKLLTFQEWTYNADEDATERHFGPFAEDFNTIFGLGNSKGISAGDMAGLSLAIIKEQQAQIEDLQERIKIQEEKTK